MFNFSFNPIFSSDFPNLTSKKSSVKNLEVYYFHPVPHDHGTGCSKQQWISSLSVVVYAILLS